MRLKLFLQVFFLGSLLVAQEAPKSATLPAAPAKAPEKVSLDALTAADRKRLTISLQVQTMRAQLDQATKFLDDLLAQEKDMIKNYQSQNSCIIDMQKAFDQGEEIKCTAAPPAPAKDSKPPVK